MRQLQIAFAFLPLTLRRYASLLFLLFIANLSMAQVIVNVGNAEGNQNVVIEITVENFTNIASAQFSVNWSTDYLSFDSLGHLTTLNLTEVSNFNTNFAPNGQVLFSWFDQAGQSVSLPNGTTLFSLHFTVLQGGPSIVDVTNTPIIIEFSDGTNVLPYLINPGGVNGTGVQFTGTVHHDENDDCTLQGGEAGLGGWVITLAGDRTYYAVTDEDGAFSVLADTGDYTATLAIPSAIWEACANDVAVTLSEANDPEVLDFSMQATADCPSLNVDVSTPFLRRCFDNTYTVTYCNEGTIPAEDPYLELELDEYLSLESASIGYTPNPDGTYTFDLGDDIEIGDCGSFQFVAYLDCDSTVLGQTHCVTAHIYPDTVCASMAGNWSGASLMVSGQCTEDEVEFVITNIGEAMDASTNYIVIEDAVMYSPNTLSPLPAQGSMPLNFPANGSTYRIEVEQVEGHPGFSMPSLAIEGCGTDGTGNFSLGFITQFSEDDADPFLSTDCQQNIGSYDPNDKMGFPVGYGSEHLIKPNVDLEYKIRFQNTGTDTAFTVVIEDTISAELDLTTLRAGAASHDYTFELHEGRLARFIFNDIMLPDSNVNEAASHGFVKFRIQQQPDLPNGTIINNSAAIYFDFNDAVWTNTTEHQVQRDFIQVSTQNVFVPGVAVDVYPNPFSEAATFQVKGQTVNQFTFSVYDLSGREVRRKSGDGATFQFHRGNLSDGVYFYRLESDGVLLSTGKMVIQ